MLKQKYSIAEKRAYWIGVGISAERHGDGAKILNKSSDKIRKSSQNGYEADNKKDIALKVTGNKRANLGVSACKPTLNNKSASKLSSTPKKLSKPKPQVFKPLSDDFEYDAYGRIKGEWIDGKFFPD